MEKLSVFIDAEINKFNEKINSEIEAYVLKNKHLFDDPVICLSMPEFGGTYEGRLVLTVKYKLMERRDLPPVVEVCDD